MEYTDDLDQLINGLKSHNNEYNQNYIDISTKMTLMGFGKEFLAYLFEMVQEGFFFEFKNGSYELDDILKNFDKSLGMKDKKKVLETLGNRMFEYFTSDYLFKDDPFIITFIESLIKTRIYVSIVDSDQLYHDIISGVT